MEFLRVLHLGQGRLRVRWFTCGQRAMTLLSANGAVLLAVEIANGNSWMWYGGVYTREMAEILYNVPVSTLEVEFRPNKASISSGFIGYNLLPLHPDEWETLNGQFSAVLVTDAD